jgi:CelD/BcsL family acetyltransferase involved in cellulose biosynthesis
MAERRLGVRDELRLYELRAPDGRLVGVAPMVLTHRPRFGALSVRMMQFVGADPNMTELRGPICRAEDQPAVLRALQRHLLERAGDWDWIEWRGLLPGDASLEALAAGGQLLAGPSTRDYFLRLPDTWEAFRSGLSRNIKESLRKCYNSLKRDGHSFAFRVVERPEAADAALDRFFELHAARAHASAGVSHLNVFEGPRARSFLRDYAKRAGGDGTLRIFQLEVGDQLVATRLGFVLGDELYLYFSGYDERWGKYSVMTTLLAETIKWAIASGLRLVNLSPGTDVSKVRWSPDAIEFQQVVQVSPTVRGMLAHRAYTALVEHAPKLEGAGVLLRYVRRRR